MWSFNLFGLLTIFGLISVELSFASLPQHAEKSLVNFMIQSRALTQENPQRSMDCFGSFAPILSKLTEDYEKEYADCVENGDKQRTLIDDNTVPQRKQLETFATSACNAVQACSENKGSQSYFECFIKQGSENTKTMYEISTNASEILVNVQEEYRLIINSQFKCTNVSERAYVEKTSATFEELHNCLLGIEPKTTDEPAISTTEVVDKEPEPTPEEPEAPTDKDPESPTDTKPETPTDTEPESPTDTEPETPTDNKPETPTDTEPETPTDNKPETPTDTEPETPTDNKPETPTDTEPETPTDNKPETPTDNKPETPIEEESEIPIDNEPETPIENEPETPIENEPETPIENEPETPIDNEPETQPETQPEEPETPSEDESSEPTDESDDSSSSDDSESGASQPRTLTEGDFLKSIFKQY